LTAPVPTGALAPYSAIEFGLTKLLPLTFRDLGRHGLMIRNRRYARSAAGWWRQISRLRSG